MLDFGVDLILELEVVGRRGINLCEREALILKIYFLRTQSVRQLVGWDLNDFGFRATNPRDAVFVKHLTLPTQAWIIRRNSRDELVMAHNRRTRIDRN